MVSRIFSCKWKHDKIDKDGEGARLDQYHLGFISSEAVYKFVEEEKPKRIKLMSECGWKEGDWAWMWGYRGLMDQYK